MTVAATSPVTAILLTGSALGPFSSVWPCAAAAEVKAFVERDGVEAAVVGDVIITEPSPVPNAVNVTLGPSHLPEGGWASGDRLILRRATPLNQAIPFGPLERYSPVTTEEAIDKLTRQVQDIQALLARSLRVTEGEAGMVLPPPSVRRNTVAVWADTPEAELREGLNVDLPLTQDVAQGNTTQAPSSDAVFNAIADDKPKFWHINDFAGNAPGVTDYGPDINVAVAHIGALGGGELWFDAFPPGGTIGDPYPIVTPIVMGNGSVNAGVATVSTINGVRLRGVGNAHIRGSAGDTGGVGTSFRWDGAYGAAMVTMRGPCAGNDVSNIVLEGNGRAANCIKLVSAQRGHFDSYITRGYTSRGVLCTTVAATSTNVGEYAQMTTSGNRFVTPQSDQSWVINKVTTSSFSGTIAGDQLSVTGVTGTIEIGQGLRGAGVKFGTTIIAGAGSVWTISNDQSVGPVAMTGTWGVGLACDEWNGYKPGLNYDTTINKLDCPLYNVASGSYGVLHEFADGNTIISPIVSSFNKGGTVGSALGYIGNLTGGGYYPAANTIDGHVAGWFTGGPIARVDVSSSPSGLNHIGLIMESPLYVAPTGDDAKYLSWDWLEQQQAGQSPGVRAPGGASHPLSFANAFLNSQFRLWTRGTTVGPLSVASSPHFADQWRISGAGTLSATMARGLFSPGQTVVPSNPKYYAQVTATGSDAGGLYVGQSIADCQLWQNQTVCVWAWMQAPSGDVTVEGVTIQQNFGSGGSGAVNASSAQAPVVVGAAWQRVAFSVAVPSTAGKTIGADDFITAFFRFAGVASIIRIATPQFNIGSQPMPYDMRPHEVDKQLCSQFIQPIAAMASGFVGYGVVTATTKANFQFELKPAMRTDTPALIAIGSPTYTLRDYANTPGTQQAATVAINVRDRNRVVIEATTSAHGFTLGAAGALIASTSTPSFLSCEF